MKAVQLYNIYFIMQSYYDSFLQSILTKFQTTHFVYC